MLQRSVGRPHGQSSAQGLHQKQSVHAKHHSFALFCPGREASWQLLHGLLENAIYGGRLDNVQDTKVGAAVACVCPVRKSGLCPAVCALRSVPALCQHQGRVT